MKSRLTYTDVAGTPRQQVRIQEVLLPPEPIGLHEHEFGELVVILAGKGIHATEDGDYPIGPHDVFYIRPRYRHGYRGLESLALHNVIFDPALVDAAPELHNVPNYHALFHLEPLMRSRRAFDSRLRLEPEQTARVKTLLDTMVEEHQEQRPGFEAVLRAWFIVLLSHIVRGGAIPGNATGRQVAGLARAVSHIAGHYAEPVTLAELVELSGMSRSTFERAFRKCYGVAPIDYLIRYRIGRACDILAQGDCRVIDVAQAVGFSDSNYFSRKFREICGVPPRAYRGRFDSGSGGRSV